MSICGISIRYSCLSPGAITTTFSLRKVGYFRSSRIDWSHLVQVPGVDAGHIGKSTRQLIHALMFVQIREVLVAVLDIHPENGHDVLTLFLVLLQTGTMHDTSKLPAVFGGYKWKQLCCTNDAPFHSEVYL